MARVVVFDQIGGPEVLKIVDLPVTEPGDDEVRIRVQAIGVNRADVMVRSGVYAWLPAFPQARLGIEATGVVDAVGAAVTDLKIGDDVLVVAVPHMDVDGVYAEYVNLPASTVIRRPAHIDAVTGAALWIVYATAYGSLIEKASMRPGDHLLITAASSAVGLAAIQVANQIGAVPIAVTRHATKRDTLLAAGAAHVIVTDDQDVIEATKAITDARGADIILDAIAGPGLPDLARALRYSGTIVVTGWLDTRPALLPMNWPLTLIGYANFEHTLDPAAIARISAFIDAGLRSGVLKPTVSKTFTLDQIVQAHTYLESGDQIGKVVVTV